jgi:hypothetical protein
MDGIEIAKPKDNTYIGDYNNMFVKQKDMILHYYVCQPDQWRMKSSQITCQSQDTNFE